MKKIIFSLFVVFALLSVANPAHALLCKSGQAGNSDECWTEVKVSSAETNVVSAGAVLMYDITTDSADTNAYQVVLTTASLDAHRVAGVAQSIIATGDTGLILVKGKGKLNVHGVTATGDRVFTSASEGHAGTTIPAMGATNTSSGDPIGFALQNSTAARATIDAYINVI